MTLRNIYIYIYMYIFVYIHLSLYIYIYIHRERERKRERSSGTNEGLLEYCGKGTVQGKVNIRGSYASFDNLSVL